MSQQSGYLIINIDLILMIKSIIIVKWNFVSLDSTDDTKLFKISSVVFVVLLNLKQTLKKCPFEKQDYFLLISSIFNLWVRKAMYFVSWIIF